MSTAVAPLSPRARPGATVSFPLTWQQVRSGLDPKRYTVTTAPSLLAKTSAWQDYDTGARPLADAIRKLTGKRGLEKIAGPGAATRRGRRQKPRFLPPASP
jgi:bifunctional non-homologous end joining protein LigD